MASWMVHLRVADALLELIPGLVPREFIMGNIAPDSGIPDESWTVFTPSKTVSHFEVKDAQGKHIDVAHYARSYFTPKQQRSYDDKQYSFYIGYLTHLLTDIQWKQQVFLPTAERCSAELAADKAAFMARMKDDWYNQDFLYLCAHPDFRAFHIYAGSTGFQNTYMDIFSSDAFDNRREYIVSFYRQPNENLDREYPYLTQQDAGRFVQDTVNWILEQLRIHYCI